MIWVDSQLKEIFPNNEPWLFEQISRLLEADDGTFATLGKDWFERTLLYKYRIGFTSLKPVGQSIGLNLTAKELLRFADYPIIVADSLDDIKTKFRKAYIITCEGEARWHVFN